MITSFQHKTQLRNYIIILGDVTALHRINKANELLKATADSRSGAGKLETFSCTRK